MIHIIKEDKGCIKTRSTLASFAPVTVKWTIENNNSNNEINIYIKKKKLNIFTDTFISFIKS